jgi:hypothetical protein
MGLAISRIPVLASVLLLAACDHTTQTTSGRDWLAANPPQKIDLTPGNIDSAVREAAAVEPTLRFPARIGIARLDRWYLSSIPADEAKAWSDAAGRLGATYGEFIPISPLVAAMVDPPHERWIGKSWNQENVGREAVEDVRLAAARQHLDAVLIYEVDATADTKSNPLSIAEWTLIGAFVLPTENVKAQGVAQGILLDVRNGYPYGTVTADADDKSTSVRFKTDETSQSLKDTVRSEVVAKLAGEAEAMFRKLQPELAALDKKPPKR